MGWRLHISAFVAMLVCTGCYSKTNIYSKPSGATVLVENRRLLGKTPIELEEQVWLWTNHMLTVKADGYETQSVQLRNTGINWGNAVICLCSLGVLLPVALTSGYPEQVVVELTPKAAAETKKAFEAGTAISFR